MLSLRALPSESARQWKTGVVDRVDELKEHLCLGVGNGSVSNAFAGIRDADFMPALDDRPCCGKRVGDRVVGGVTRTDPRGDRSQSRRAYDETLQPVVESPGAGSVRRSAYWHPSAHERLWR